MPNHLKLTDLSEKKDQRNYAESYIFRFYEKWVRYFYLICVSTLIQRCKINITALEERKEIRQID